MGWNLAGGAAGVIGNAVSMALRARGDALLGIDNCNDYYALALKRARLERARLAGVGALRFAGGFADPKALALEGESFNRIVHLDARLTCAIRSRTRRPSPIRTLPAIFGCSN